MGSADCLFCKIARKEIPSKIVFEDDQIIAFSDIKPQASVHTLIIPRRHIEKVSDLTDKDAELVGRLVLRAKDIAGKAGVEYSGYRIVLNCGGDAGQEVPHIHLHLLGGRRFNWPPG